MLVRVDAGSSEPLYEQVAGQLRRQIADGVIGAGERLPAAAELARAVGVNLHTVLRAYGQLRDAGLIELRPRRGAVVRASGPVRAGLVEQVRDLVRVAREQGVSSTELLEMIGAQL